jgi:hypothetical protein
MYTNFPNIWSPKIVREKRYDGNSVRSNTFASHCRYWEKGFPLLKKACINWVAIDIYLCERRCAFSCRSSDGIVSNKTDKDTAVYRNGSANVWTGCWIAWTISRIVCTGKKNENEYTITYHCHIAPPQSMIKIETPQSCQLVCDNKLRK